MKSARLGMIAIGLAVGGFVACSDTPTTPGGGDDAAVADAATPTPEASLEDRSPPPPPPPPPPVDAAADATVDATVADAADASTVDAADASTVDAADAAPPPCGAGGTLCNLGETCAIDGDCASPNVCEANVCAAEPPVRTMADVAGLTGFDFENGTLVYTSSAAATSVYTCTLPGCADAAPVPNITLAGRLFPPSVANGYIQYPTLSNAGQTYTVAASRSLDGATAGPSATYNCADRLGTPTTPTLAGTHSGSAGWAGLYKCLTDTRTSTGFFYRFATIGAPAQRNDRVGRGSPGYHSNMDATVSLVPGTQTVNPTGPPTQASTYLNGTVITSVLWGRAESMALPSEMVTSPKTFGGVDIASPTVALRTAGVVKIARGAAPVAFPTVVASGATTINIDERYLYVGKATGLGRCELSEIKATSTCTLAPLSADAVDAPLYITATHAWYRSGTLVRRVAK